MPEIPGSTDTDVTADEFLIDSGSHVIDHGNGITQVFDRNGNESWYRNGKLHRDNDLPARIWVNGTMVWYRNGYLHRDGDKPAVIDCDGTQQWCKSNRLHRSKGPAVVYGNGVVEWWIRGKSIPQRPVLPLIGYVTTTVPLAITDHVQNLRQH